MNALKYLTYDSGRLHHIRITPNQMAHVIEALITRCKGDLVGLRGLDNQTSWEFEVEDGLRIAVGPNALILAHPSLRQLEIRSARWSLPYDASQVYDLAGCPNERQGAFQDLRDLLQSYKNQATPKRRR
jgi:hypothetical protein